MIELAVLPLLAALGCWLWFDLERLRDRRLRYESELVAKLEDAQARKGTVF